ncbi:MAG: peptidoglycan DD-metalloendopeptidase family protein [Hyphomicrobium sp.]
MSSRGSSGLVVLATTVMAGLGGCSADLSRFDFPSSVSLNDSASETGAIPDQSDPGADSLNSLAADSSAPQPYSPPSNRGPGVDVTALPDASSAAPPASPPSSGRNFDRQSNPGHGLGAPMPPSAPAGTAAAQPWPVDNGRAPASEPVVAPSLAGPAERGDVIEVRSGDTLYGLSRRHRVSINDLTSLNDLKGTNLKPGQKLYLPAGKSGRVAVSDAPAQAAPAESARIPVDAPSDWTGSYVVKAGDSLYAIARQHKVKMDDLQRFNAIQDVRRVKPGVVLRMPAGVGTQFATNGGAVPADSVPLGAVDAPVAPARNGQAPALPTILNSSRPPADGRQVIAVNTPNSSTDPAAPAGKSGSGSPAEAGKLRWPAQGKIIAGFGQRPDGTHNDGVNLAVPMGTEIHAAESGVVAYAGSELKGYGNLILLRHDNGWVTAYAHSEELLVKRGDKVRRGQVIAKAGKTGQVDQPQLHFELRQGQRPVDPTPYMDKL